MKDWISQKMVNTSHAVLSSDDFFQNQLFEKKILKYHQSQTVWMQIRPDILSCLICIQTVCKGISSEQKSPSSKESVKINRTIIFLQVFHACES